MLNEFLTKPQARPAFRIKSLRPTAVSIQRATQADVGLLSTICWRGFEAAHRGAFFKSDMVRYLASAFNRRQLTAELNDESMFYLTAKVAGEVVGTMRLHAAAAPVSVGLVDSVEMSRFYLRPEQTGQGIGSKLMLHALSTAVASGYKSAWLIVWHKNVRAIRFYKRWGFEVVGKDTNQHRPKQPNRSGHGSPTLKSRREFSRKFAAKKRNEITQDYYAQWFASSQ